MGNPFDKVTPVADAPVTPVTPAPVTPVVPVTPEVVAPAEKPAAEAPVKAPEGEGTLLGQEEKVEKTAEEKAAEAAEATKVAEAKAKVDAENKKLLEADDKTLTPEQLAKKQELIKAEADAKAKADVVPDKYTLTAPKGMTVDQDFLDNKLAPVLKENKITQAAFQKIIDVYAPHLQAQQKMYVEAQQTEAIKAWKENVKAWGEETKAIYGSKLNAEMAYAAKAINKFSSDPKALRELMNDKPGTTGTGIGNNKLIVEFMIKAGKLLGEDTFPKGNPAPGEKDTSDEAKAKRLFPNNP